MHAIDRRTFCAALGALGLLQIAGPVFAQARPARPELLMWHAPGCGCCLEWVKRVEAAFGAPMTVRETGDMLAVKRGAGVPDDLFSCHTARIGGYFVEGHVPPADIRRLIAARPAGVRGLAVPGMPLGSPGMDVGHDRTEPYEVIAFGPSGTSVFARHG